jgi:hypothetical protein
MNGFGLDDPFGKFRRSTEMRRFQKGAAPSQGISLGFAARMHQLPEDRKQLIFRIRRQIAENSYDTPQKLEVAMERLFDTLADNSEES